MPILSIFDLSPEVVVYFGRFLKYNGDLNTVEFNIMNGPRMQSSEFMRYNKLGISNDDQFQDRYHLTYYIQPNEKKIPNKEYILDINPFMVYCGFMNFYIWMMYIYVFLFGN